MSSFLPNRSQRSLAPDDFELEVREGPFEVKGQEQRRVIGTHATHQTQSVPGSGGLSDEKRASCRESRKLGGCAICARNMWLEDLYDMQLFTEPSHDVKTAEDRLATSDEACKDRFAL